VTDSFLVTDTHPLVWYLANQEKKLPKKVLAAFKSAEEGNGAHIWVPAAVVWEFSQLLRKTVRIKVDAPFGQLVRENFFMKSVTLAELQPADLILAHEFSFNRDPFDSLIVATAVRLGLPLMTADHEITDAEACDVFWK
jgi:PIN domain nuclease of toxin-antitoxin system